MGDVCYNWLIVISTVFLPAVKMAYRDKLTMRKTSTRDIANVAGVSQATVSYILNGRKDQGISEPTRARVLQAASELNYRPNRVAPSVFRGYTHMLGVLMPDSDSSFFARILSGIQQACHEADFAIHLAYSEREQAAEQKDISLMLEHRVAGIIVVETGESLREQHRWLAGLVAEGVPCAMIDDRSLAGTVECVVSDDLDGGALAARHLIEHGHKRIGFITNSCSTSAVRDRRDGFLAAMRDEGLDCADLVSDDVLHMREMEPVIDKWLRLPNPPTAIFAGSDYVASHVIGFLEERGVSVPGDVAVIGYADTELSEGLRLTTVRQDARRMGYLAAKRMLARLNGDISDAEVVRVDTSLVIRRSCGCH
jgi:LacI family transcriptional regulator